MHYYVDGYNLLFRYMGGKEDFQTFRQEIIVHLAEQADRLCMHISVVFDAAYRKGLGSRGHYRHLEILFTDEGESADGYILQAIERSSHPHQKVVVTSDKHLARLARHLSARTESIGAFIAFISKGPKKERGASKKIAIQKRIQELQQPLLKKSSDEKKTTLLRSQENERWLKLFEREIRETLEEPDIL